MSFLYSFFLFPRFLLKKNMFFIIKNELFLFPHNTSAMANINNGRYLSSQGVFFLWSWFYPNGFVMDNNGFEGSVMPLILKN